VKEVWAEESWAKVVGGGEDILEGAGREGVDFWLGVEGVLDLGWRVGVVLGGIGAGGGLR